MTRIEEAMTKRSRAGASTAAPVTGAPAGLDNRMRYLSTLESMEKSSYAEFAKVADAEGLKKIAKVFREILHEEKKHDDTLSRTKDTLVNIRTAMKREVDKIDIINSIIEDADKEKDSALISRLRMMANEEKTHVERLDEALQALEKDMEAHEKDAGKEDTEQICIFNVCTTHKKKPEKNKFDFDTR